MGLSAPRTAKNAIGRCDELAKAIHKATRPRCEVEGCPRSRERGDPIHWAHVQGRTYHHTRHDEDNVVALCYGHHMNFTNRPLEFIEWIGEERWLALKDRALNRAKIDWLTRESNLWRRCRELGVTPAGR